MVALAHVVRLLDLVSGALAFRPKGLSIVLTGLLIVVISGWFGRLTISGWRELFSIDFKEHEEYARRVVSAWILLLGVIWTGLGIAGTLGLAFNH